MRTKRDSAFAAAIALVPWWLWLILSVVAWALARAILTFAPASTGSIPHALSASLYQVAGLVLSVLGPVTCVLLAILSALQRRRTRSVPTVGVPDGVASVDTSVWSADLLRALEWKRLEQLSAAYFRALKFRVEECPPGPDGGIDLRLFAESSERPAILVQCKAWSSWKVGVKEVRALLGVMSAEAVSEGILVTTSSFTEEAKRFAEGANITLIDGEDLLKKLLDLQAEDRDEILRPATSGDFTTPTCPSCGLKMVKRTARVTGRSFWGCSGFPRCRSTIQIGGSSMATQ